MDSIHGTTVYGAVRHLTLCLWQIIVRYMKYNFDVTRPRYSEYVLPVSRLFVFWTCLLDYSVRLHQDKNIQNFVEKIIAVSSKGACSCPRGFTETNLQKFLTSSFPTDTRLSSKLEQVQVC